MLNIGSAKISRLLPNRLITTKSNKDNKTLYITFDDGPNPRYTMEVCELLSKYSAKASFFCIGKCIESYPDIAKNLIEMGHMVANHSNTHRNFSSQPLDSQLAEIIECQSRISEIDPYSLRVFRAPKGQLNFLLMCSLIVRRWRIVHWSYDSLDYKNGALSDHLEKFRTDPVADGDILLFHDDNQLTIDMLAVLLPIWAKEGYKFETVRELVS